MRRGKPPTSGSATPSTAGSTTSATAPLSSSCSGCTRTISLAMCSPRSRGRSSAFRQSPKRTRCTGSRRSGDREPSPAARVKSCIPSASRSPNDRVPASPYGIGSADLFFVSVLIFGLQQLLPGDPALAPAGENQEPAVFASLHQKYHLDQLLPVRCALWVEAYCRAISASDPDQAAGFGSLLRKIAGDRRAGIIGARRRLGYRCASGVIAAVKNDTMIDYRAMVALWGLSIPNCWLGILLILLFSGEMGLLPASDFVGQVPVFVRLTRGQVLLV